MRECLAKCGCNCGHCPAFKENAKTMKDRKYCRDGWNKYLGTNIKKYAWIRCDGCQARNPWKKGNLLPDRSCNIRPCVLKMDIDTCAKCSLFPCTDLKARIPDKDFRKHVEHRLGEKTDTRDYEAFIRPYEGIENLRKINNKLRKKDITACPKVLPLKTRNVAFPEKFKANKMRKAAFKQLHDFMLKLLTARSKTYARQIRMISRKPHLLGLLWAFGLYGELRNGTRAQLVLDSVIQRRRPQIRYFVRKRDNRLFEVYVQSFNIMKNFGVIGKFIPLKEHKWLLKLSFNKKAGGKAVLKALKEYTSILTKTYGEPEYAGNSRLKGKAYNMFKVADMRILSK